MYSTEIEGQVWEFGTSGLLFRSNKLMYDRGTKSLWHQFTGEPVVGALVGSGIELELLPIVLTTWGDWLAAHPDTTVLDIETGLYRPDSYVPEWDPQSIYYGVRQQPVTSFPVWLKSDRLPEKSDILGLVINGEARAYPRESLRQQPVLNDSLGGRDLVVITLGDGAGARAFQTGGRKFATLRPAVDCETKAIIVDDAGIEWRLEEDALVGVTDPSRRLARLPSHVSYWFGWYSFHPSTSVYGQD